MAQQIQLRRDTAANWTSVNPILAEGEIGIELNSGQYKIGDGVSHWNSITYAGLIPGLTATAPITYNSGTKTIGWSGSKSDVGLGNVDNTSDANKPVSTAQAAADASVLSTAEAYTDSRITSLVNSAPSALDTLKELADALGSDSNFSATVSTALGNRLRVDTAAQGLSSTQKNNAKTNVDLQNVDNTSDANKPVSTAQAAADAAVQAFAIQRANHTGTQTASTISDFDSAADARASALIAALNSGNLPHTPAADGWFTAAISTIKAALDSLAKGRALHPVVLPESITVPTGFVLIRENTEIPSGLDITLEGTATLRII